MKKLPILWFAFWSGALFAQINQSQHTLAVVAGPNWFEQYDGWLSPYFTYSRPGVSSPFSPGRPSGICSGI